MASIFELQGAFGSLIDTLQNRLDTTRPEPEGSHWLGVIQRVAGIARDTAAWDRLPFEDAAFDGVISSLDGAARTLAAAALRGGSAVSDALSGADAALDDLQRLF